MGMARAYARGGEPRESGVIPAGNAGRVENGAVGNGAPERVAIVTGAARGIGAAISKRLAADGRAVAVLDLAEDSTRDTVEAIRSAGGRAIGIGADVAQAQQV